MGTVRFIFSESGNQTDPVARLHGTEGGSRIQDSLGSNSWILVGTPESVLWLWRSWETAGPLDTGEPRYGFARTNDLNSENSNLSQEVS